MSYCIKDIWFSHKRQSKNVLAKVRGFQLFSGGLNFINPMQLAHHNYMGISFKSLNKEYNFSEMQSNEIDITLLIKNSSKFIPFYILKTKHNAICGQFLKLEFPIADTLRYQYDLLEYQLLLALKSLVNYVVDLVRCTKFFISKFLLNQQLLSLKLSHHFTQ